MKKLRKAIAFMMVFCMILTMQTVPIQADGSGITMENHSFKWLSGSSVTKIDGNQLTITPSSNSNASVTAQVMFSCGGDEGIPANNAVIRIPKNVFYDRDGNPTGTVELAIPKAPATSSSYDFNYTFETIDGVEYIVLRNHKDLEPGGFFFRADIVWNINSVEIANGATSADFQAQFEVTGAGGGEALTATSDELKATMVTAPKASSASKQCVKREQWQDEWGVKPDDADDYYYVVWTLKQSMSSSQTTSPYDMYFIEEPDAKSNGEVVAWANYSYYSFADEKPTANGTGKSTDFKNGTLEQMNEDPVISLKTLDEIKKSANNYMARDVVMRYPRSATENNQTPTVKNQFHAEFQTPENRIAQKVTLASYTYQHVSVDGYSGDAFDMYKAAQPSYTETTSNHHNYRSYGGALNILRNGNSVTAGWAIDVKNFSWTKTKNGTKTYDTVLRDGNMYVGGERLVAGDYNLSKFYPVAYDSYFPVWDEDEGSKLAVVTDYTNEDFYAPIKVYTKGASGDFVYYGQITKEEKNIYNWEGADGTTKVCTSTSPVDLPKDTLDIKYVHTGKAYGIEYRMGLYYDLHPTDHLLGLIGDSTTEFDLVNINEAWAEQDNKIYTLGNKLGDSTTPGIKADVEAQDKQEFGEENRVYHDYASHNFTAINGTGNFSKTMSKPQNDLENQRVKIPVNMTWDYYYNYSKLGITLEEAIDANIINEARESVFYDLLPVGTTVDLSSIKAQTYSTTDINGRRIPDCDYTVEMVNNWRNSGQTMMIVRVQAPDGYRNFARSSTYADTGFRLSFNMYDSYENIAANGGMLQNNAAMYCMEGSVPGGKSDTGEGSRLPDMFNNLNAAGADSGLENNVKYAKSDVSITIPTAAQMGFSKKVKGAGDISYAKSTSIPVGGDYNYQMRFALQAGSTTRNVVLYDVLESAYDKNAYWQGTFKSVDVSGIVSQFPDVNPVIYYSTSNAFGDMQATSGIDYTDLTNTDLWSTTPPDDLSKVSAVAVDISKDKNGQIIEYKGEFTVSAEIYMKAPTSYENRLDDPVTADVNETVYAYNQSYIKTGNGRVEGSDITTVGMKLPDIEIKKSGSVFGGNTAGNAGKVLRGQTFVYQIDIKNKNLADALNNATAVDTIPDGLEIDESQIEFYFGQNSLSKTTVGDDKRVQAKVEGQKVTFDIDALAANQTVHLFIPVKVKDDQTAGTVFTNKAQVTHFNDEDYEGYESNEVNHKVQSVKVNLPVKKTITGATQPAKKRFTFKMTPIDGAPMPKSDEITINGATTVYYSPIEYFAAGTYEYDIQEIDSNYTGYTFDQTKHRIVVTVTENNGALTAKWKDNDTNVTSILFTNQYQPLQTTLSLPVKKTMITDHNIPDNHKETFIFKLIPGSKTNPMPTADTVSVDGLDNNGDSVTKEFDDITFTEVGTYYYTVKEQSANKKNGYVYDLSSHQVKVVVKDVDGQLQATWTSGAQKDAISFTNEYAPKADVVQFNLSKVTTGHVRLDKYKKAFTFTLEGLNNAPMPQSTSTTIVDGGDAILGQIAIAKAGTYEYLIKETKGNDTGYTYDDDICKVTVVATDNQGQIETTIKYSWQDKDGNPIQKQKFENKYQPVSTKQVFEVNKVISGNTQPEDKLFTFILEGKDNAPMPDITQVTINGQGKATFSEIKYTKTGTYTYTIKEQQDSYNGYTFDQEVYTATVKVEDNDGTLTKTVTYKNSQNKDVTSLDFTNKYAPAPVEKAFDISKTITGDARVENQKQAFTFTLTAKDNAPMPAGTGNVVTIKDSGNGTFGNIKYTSAGTYSYQISENDDGKLGYTYDQNVYDVKVEVSDTDGVLSAQTTYALNNETKDQIVFTNNYQPISTQLALTAEKEVDGHVRVDEYKKTFDFIISGENNAPMPTNNKASIVDSGTATFENIVFEHAGVYTYTIQEDRTNEATNKGYTYDQSIIKATVTVTDNNGQLEKNVVYTKGNETVDGIKFTNTYAPKETTVSLPVEKVIEGNERDENLHKDFNFTIESPDQSPLPQNTTITINDHGTASFDAITYDTAGTYNYVVKEVVGSDHGYTYSTESYNVKVTVEDKDGELVATYKVNESDDTTISFTNNYKPDETTVSLPVQKIIEGNERQEGLKKDFTFMLEAKDDEPMPESDTITINDEGEASFGDITYDKAGTYYYTIKENNDQAIGYTYDDHVYNVTVLVKDFDGVLGSTYTIDEVENAKAVFTNTYAPKKADVNVTINKVISGDSRLEKDKQEFKFTLVGKENEPMPSDNTVSIKDEGKGTFKTLEFDKVGTYTYTITENNTGATGYTYSKDVYTVTVTVTDEDGILKADVVYTKDNNKTKEITFINTYTAPKMSTKTGDSTQIMLYINMLCASILSLVFVFIKKKQTN